MSCRTASLLVSSCCRLIAGVKLCCRLTASVKLCCRPTAGVKLCCHDMAAGAVVAAMPWQQLHRQPENRRCSIALELTEVT